MFTRKFWKEATERALKTFAQFILVVGSADTFNVFTIDRKTNLGLALGGAICRIFCRRWCHRHFDV